MPGHPTSALATSCPVGTVSAPSRLYRAPVVVPYRCALAAVATSAVPKITATLHLMRIGTSRKSGTACCTGSGGRRSSARKLALAHRTERGCRRLRGAVDLRLVACHVQAAVGAERRDVDEPHVGRLLGLVRGEHRVRRGFHLAAGGADVGGEPRLERIE